MPKAKPKKEEVQKRDMPMIDGKFVGNMESLRVFVTSVTPFVEKHDLATKERMKNFSERIKQILGETEQEQFRETLKKMSKDEIEKLAEQIISATRVLGRVTQPQAELLHRSSFVLLMSYLDFLFSDLLYYYYGKYPDSLSGKELSLSLSELKLFDSIGDALTFLIDKKVDSVLYGRLDEQRGHFQTALKIDTEDDLIEWKRLVEATERRNIIVHNDSKINRRYLSSVDLRVIPEKPKEIKEGKTLNIDKEYFARVFEEVFVAGLALIQNCWRKWEKDTVNKADTSLNAAIYDALCAENWRVAERLGLFSKGCQISSQQLRLYLDVNYCQSLKWQGKKTELEKELKQFDVSTLSPIYLVAVSALKSDADSFYSNIENAIKVDNMKKDDFMQWPLFRELRQTPDYEDRIIAASESVSKKGQPQSS